MKVSDTGIASDEEELLEPIGNPGFLQQPEEPFYSHVHDVFWRFFAGRQVNDMGDVPHGLLDESAIGNGAIHGFDPIMHWQGAFVT